MANAIIHADSQIFGLSVSVELAREAYELILAYETRPKTPDEKAGILAMFASAIAVCRSQNESETSSESYVKGMLQRLEQEPLDCVVAALKEWPETSKWRPMWADLKALIVAKNKVRNGFRAGLYHCAGGWKSGLTPNGGLQ